MRLVDRKHGYSKAEEISDATIHVLGLGMAIFGVLALIPLTIKWSGDAKVVAASGVYAVALLAMLSASAAYNMSRQGIWKDRLRRLDHSAIYLKIAGTYTPFLVLSGMAPWLLITFLWTSAGLGTALRVLAPGRFVGFCLSLYLLMGWSGVVIGSDFLANLDPTTFTLMMIGGLIYTAGVGFFLWESLPFHYTIWHAFVLVATGFFYAALITELAGPAMGVMDKI